MPKRRFSFRLLVSPKMVVFVLDSVEGSLLVWVELNLIQIYLVHLNLLWDDILHYNWAMVVISLLS